MSKDTFEGWCTPASISDMELGKYADHTFVYCSNKNESFKCWGSADREARDAARVCSRSSSKAYCKASKYRKVPHTPWEDTACVGIYGINGVCHQSANLFLYAAGTTLPLNQSRPKGILASHALFGVYGADLPGDAPSFTTHFAAWNVAWYAQAKTLCWIASAVSSDTPEEDPFDLISKITRLHLERLDSPSGIGKKESSSLVPQEMQVLLTHYLPDADNSDVRRMHEEIMVKKDDIFASYGLVRSTGMATVNNLPKGRDIAGMVEKLNNLALEFQSQVTEEFGISIYEKINGDRNYYRPIDPVIARMALDAVAGQ